MLLLSNSSVEDRICITSYAIFDAFMVVRLGDSFPMDPCSTSRDKNSLRYDLGPHHCDCHVSTQ